MGIHSANRFGVPALGRGLVCHVRTDKLEKEAHWLSCSGWCLAWSETQAADGWDQRRLQPYSVSVSLPFSLHPLVKWVFIPFVSSRFRAQSPGWIACSCGCLSLPFYSLQDSCGETGPLPLFVLWTQTELDSVDIYAVSWRAYQRAHFSGIIHRENLPACLPCWQ